MVIQMLIMWAKRNVACHFSKECCPSSNQQPLLMRVHPRGIQGGEKQGIHLNS